MEIQKKSNYDWHLRRWLLYHFSKLLVDSRFKFVGSVSQNLEATYTKANLPVLVLTFGRWKLPLEAYLVLKQWRIIIRTGLEAPDTQASLTKLCNLSKAFLHWLESWSNRLHTCVMYLLPSSMILKYIYWTVSIYVFCWRGRKKLRYCWRSILSAPFRKNWHTQYARLWINTFRKNRV